MSKNMKLIHAFEQLDAIEKAEGDSKVELLKKYGSTAPLAMILSLNFNDKIMLDVPSGMPRLKNMDSVTHADLQGLLSSSIKLLKYCLVSNDKLKRFKKERKFMDVLENCPLKDAEIVCSAKDGALEELYPSITSELVSASFANYVYDSTLKVDNEKTED